METRKSINEIEKEFLEFNSQRFNIWVKNGVKPILGDFLNCGKSIGYGIRFYNAMPTEDEYLGEGLTFHPIKEIEIKSK